MKLIAAITFLALSIPGSIEAQRDVTRRAWTFLDNRLTVAVHAEAPGELQVVRGQRGRVEVAARSRDGFAGFGFGGDISRELRLTAVGSDEVQYLVVVPEHVVVRVRLPDGNLATVPTRGPVATYRWGDATPAAHEAGVWDAAPIAPTTASGLYVVHTGNRVPSTVDIPDLASVRSISVRVQGDVFSVAASRPLALDPGSVDRLEIVVSGQPLDIVMYIPRRTNAISVRSGTQRLAQVRAGRPEGFCGGVVLQSPTDHQDWLTLFPRDGRLTCR